MAQHSAAAQLALAPPAWRATLTTLLAIVVGGVIPLLVIGRAAVSVLVPVAAGLALTLLSMPRNAAAWRAPLARPAGVAVAVLIAAWTVSAALSIAPAHSLAVLGQSAGLVVLIFVIAAVLGRGDGAALTTALRALAAMAALGGLVAVVALHAWPPILAFRFGRALDPGEARAALKAYGAVQPCLAPFLVWAALSLGGAWRWMALAALPVGVAIVLGTGNRAALGGYGGMLALAALAWVALRLARPWRAIVVALLAMLGGAAAALIVDRLPALPYRGEASLSLPARAIDPHRQVIWAFTLQKAIERPVFGWGLSAVNRAPGAKDKIPEIGFEHIPLHPHNWVLQLFAETGFVGLAAALAALVAWLGVLLRGAAAGAAAAWAGLSLSGAFFVSGLANFSIWAARWQAVFVVLAALALAGLRRARRRGAA